MFQFDTEDYVSPFADDAIKRLADLLSEEGIRGCFNLVGELARVLKKRGREDVLASLRRHEINYHTDKHSWHPTLAEYSDTDNWQAAYDRFIAEEKAGAEEVKRTFGVDELPAFVPPGTNVSAPTMHAAVDLGMRMFGDSVFRETGGKAIWFCNALTIEYNEYLDDLLLKEGFAGAKTRLEGWTKLERLIFCVHPNMVTCVQFWDALNMKGSNLVPWGEWQLPERRTDEKVERFYEDFRQVVRMLKSHGAFEFVTYSDLWHEHGASAVRHLSREKLVRLLSMVDERLFYAEADGESYSLADLFQASAHYLSGRKTVFRTGRPIGPMHEPEGTAVPLKLEAGTLARIAEKLADERVIPHRIPIGEEGGDSAWIGPADFLRAAAQVLGGAADATIRPGLQLPDLSGFYGFGKLQLKGTWIYADSFKDEYVSRALKWQSWTIRSAH